MLFYFYVVIFSLLSPCYFCNTICNTVSCLDLFKLLKLMSSIIVENDAEIDEILYLIYLLLQNIQSDRNALQNNNDIFDDNIIISESFFNLLCSYCCNHPIAWLLLKYIGTASFIDPNISIDFILKFKNSNFDFELFKSQFLNLIVRHYFSIDDYNSFNSVFLLVALFIYVSQLF